MAIKAHPKRAKVEAEMRALGRRPSWAEIELLHKKHGPDTTTILRWAKKLYPEGSTSNAGTGASPSMPEPSTATPTGAAASDPFSVTEPAPNPESLPVFIEDKNATPGGSQAALPGMNTIAPPPAPVPIDVKPLVAVFVGMFNARIPAAFPEPDAPPPIQPVSDAEAEALAQALQPVADKYLPMILDQWGLEVNLVVVAGAIIVPRVLAGKAYAEYARARTEQIKLQNEAVKRAALGVQAPSVGLYAEKPEPDHSRAGDSLVGRLNGM